MDKIYDLESRLKNYESQINSESLDYRETISQLEEEIRSLEL